MKKLISGLLAAAILLCSAAPIADPSAGGSIVIEASAATTAKLKAPDGLKATVKTNSVTLKWNAVKGADAYQIYRYDSKQDKYLKLSRVKGTSCTINGLVPSVSYKYRIAAMTLKDGKYYVQTPTKVINITAKKLSTPAKITVVPAQTSITFKWTAVEGADAYRLFQYDASKKKYVAVASTTGTTCTVKNLKNKTAYKFKLAALVKNGKSYLLQQDSDAISVSTGANGSAEHVSGYRGGTSYPALKHDLDYMYKLNTDFIGWLTIKDTPIDIPVVQASNNKFYLEHDFYGRVDKSKVGTVFADSHVPVTKNSRPQNLIIYGHNIRTGVGLAKITNYYPARYGSLNFYKTHPTIKYESIYGGTSTYIVFAGMYVNVDKKHGDVFQYYKFRDFTNKNTFYQYFEAVFDRSVFYNPTIDIDYTDEFLTLSTCYYPYGQEVDTRFVLFARKARKTDKVIDGTKAYINPSPLYFDYYYKINGGKWAGRKWPETLMKGYSDWKKTQNKKQS